MGDEGSGYAIGANILKAVASAADGRGEATQLLEAVLSKLGIDEAYNIIDWVYKDLAWDRIASLHPLAEQYYPTDSVSRRIIDESVQHLLTSLTTVINAINLNENPFPVVFSGGVLTHPNSIIGPMLAEKVKLLYKNADIRYPQVKLELASALLAFNDVNSKSVS